MGNRLRLNFSDSVQQGKFSFQDNSIRDEPFLDNFNYKLGLLYYWANIDSKKYSYDQLSAHDLDLRSLTPTLFALTFEEIINLIRHSQPSEYFCQK